MSYDQMTMEDLADIADARLATIPGCAALPRVIWAIFPQYRTDERRRAALVAALNTDDEVLSAQQPV